ncbi:branched-chain amino acid transport system ATP-binding protein [Evansella vedderi]|uniref:Branched-chain amino acid transport system ATP-binding protein n=1 Tax=Evansella vedderi TaxID=38282 RepID=A0ABU0A0Y9_9BACI|nr:ABC transporter ATP-binding protein [Evansella vedderi]MDQ0256910.1 branched-chain amino acid transport system ATP-binding protein [Evansella vedderi]
MLKIKDLHTHIEQFHILQGVNLEVPDNSVTVVLGRNGAGKTTTIRSVMGFYPNMSGEILFQGKSIAKLPPYTVAKQGIGYVPEDQDIFAGLTVEENMRVAMRREDDTTLERQEWLLDLFPDLREAWKRKGGHLSGGQKQMLSIARALVNETPLLLVDEPSKGLAPIMVEKVMEAMNVIRETTTILLVEQNFIMASQLGDYFYMIDEGRTVFQGEMQLLKDDEVLRKKYLGIA